MWSIRIKLKFWLYDNFTSTSFINYLANPQVKIDLPFFVNYDGMILSAILYYLV